MKEAWLKVYGIICSVMQPAMKDEWEKVKKEKAAKRKPMIMGAVAAVAALGAMLVMKK